MILIDSNVWLFAHLEDYPEHETAEPLVEQMLKEDVIATNAIVVSEVYHKMSLILDRQTAAAKVSAILESAGVRCLTMQRETIAKAVSMASRLQMRINDALIAQQALEEGATILTDDRRSFKKVKGLRIRQLNPPNR
ncbi:MAG: PIN domain-containing protein [Candidatus Aenigmarchaeota archaeon]|nr:PIN domain-containing protein [Candidatus Aenigmarchaeota archaeon]